MSDAKPLLGAEEVPPRAMLRYAADRIGADPEAFAPYARREEIRRDHTARLMAYLDARSATAQDRRAALLPAIQAAAMSDDGAAIAGSIVTSWRERGSLLPAIDTIERIGLTGRAIACRRAERTLIEDIPLDTLQSLDRLLEVDLSIGQPKARPPMCSTGCSIRTRSSTSRNTDTDGASDHVFGLFALIGKRFAPRLRNLKDRKFYTFEKGDTYPGLLNHIGAPINATLILDHWDDLLHLAASITTRAVVPSTILKKLSASPKESQLAKALRNLAGSSDRCS